MADRPSFLFFVTDQQRFDHAGFAGNPVVQTPHLDSIARSGVTFRRAYVNNPLCIPARASLFTGLTPRGHGVRTNGIPLSPALPTMPEALRQVGYRTHAVGKLHLGTFLPPNGASPTGNCSTSSRILGNSSTFGLDPSTVRSSATFSSFYWNDWSRPIRPYPAGSATPRPRLPFAISRRIRC